MILPASMLLLLAQTAAPQAHGAHHGAAAARCVAPAALPAGLSGWSKPQPMTAGTGDTVPVLRVGQAATLRLHAAADGKVREGVVAFDVVEAGTYRVALERKGWIDVLRDGRSLESSGHGHGPDCTGIRKIVDFTLTPGRHVVKLTGLDADAVRVLVVRG